MRWTPKRKMEVVTEIEQGKITREQACETHGLSIEELTGWIKAASVFGADALRTTRIQDVRYSMARVGGIS